MGARWSWKPEGPLPLFTEDALVTEGGPATFGASLGDGLCGTWEPA